MRLFVSFVGKVRNCPQELKTIKMERSSNANEEVHSNTQKAALVIVF